MSHITLSRASLEAAELPPYEGIGLNAITLVTSAILAEEAIAALLANEVIGFDTESKPTFRKGEVTSGPHLIQLATETRAYLFPLPNTQTTSALKEVLESPRLLKVGFGLGNDRSALKSRLAIEISNVFDLGEILRGKGHKGTVGAKVAVAHFFGKALQKSKKVGTSNWSTPNLSTSQLIYAANDAHVALQIYRVWKENQQDIGPT